VGYAGRTGRRAGLALAVSQVGAWLDRIEHVLGRPLAVALAQRAALDPSVGVLEREVVMIDHRECSR